MARLGAAAPGAAVALQATSGGELLAAAARGLASAPGEQAGHLAHAFRALAIASSAVLPSGDGSFVRLIAASGALLPLARYAARRWRAAAAGGDGGSARGGGAAFWCALASVLTAAASGSSTR
jgi:hypothetical protein